MSSVLVPLRWRRLEWHHVAKSWIRFLFLSSCPKLMHPSICVIHKWEDSELYLDPHVQGERRLSWGDRHPYLLLPRNHVWFHELLWDLELSHHRSQQQVCDVVVWLTGLVSSFKRITRLKSVRTVLMSVVSWVLKLSYDLKIIKSVARLRLCRRTWTYLFSSERIWSTLGKLHRNGLQATDWMFWCLRGETQTSIWWLWWRMTHLCLINMTEPPLS